MVDIHSHVLPRMDDGSRNSDMSTAMLRESARQGIGCVAATPHFYPSENSLDAFLERRERAAARLKELWEPDFPRLLLGAEVYYFDSISHADGLESLCIEGTGLLLLEMPFAPWTERMAEGICHLNRRPGITVVLAHIERYLPFQKKTVWAELLQEGVLMQANAEFFLERKKRRKAMRMLKSGQIHLLGSDCHNLEDRAPRLGQAMEIIGREGMEIVESNVKRCLPFLEEGV